ncbi:amidase [Paraburkholderia sp. BCC1886]|uniref:amidase n=1 Tax=Paraburkholderia sp. BCC1886 TaxID=2562670 RepID=UPI001181D4C2|nr:amidase [Paraburkholderia sp. BCC1886]
MPADIPTALGLSNDYARGRTDPVSVVETALARAADTPAAFIVLTPERARAEAAASAARWKNGTPLSPLDGVPVAWKDLFDIAGTVTTAGSAVIAKHAVAHADARLVASAARAGMICIGKTNLSEFAYSGLGLNPHFGTPVNRALDGGSRVPGGSSSGAAVAVAAGVVPLAIGTDTGGSVRIPAAFNGIVGYRASTTRYPKDGSFPLSPTLDTIGPLARSVADCIAFDSAVRGNTLPAPIMPASLKGQRFVIDPAFSERHAVSEPVLLHLRALVDRLREAGAQVEARRFPTLDRVHELIRTHGWFGGLEAFDLHRALLDSPEAAQIDQRVRTRLEASRTVPAERRAFLRAQRLEMIASFRNELADATLIAPTVPHVAPVRAPLEADPELFARINLQTLSMTMPGSFLDTPAVALPSRTDADGLPTSVQLMRAQNDDDALLRTALSVQHHASCSSEI